MIGFTLGALIAPTLFLRRGSMINLVLGGGYLGMAGGVIAHVVRAKQEGYLVNPDLQGMVADVEEVKDAVKAKTVEK